MDNISNEMMFRGLIGHLWEGSSPDETLSKRYRLFVLTGAILIALFALYRFFAGMDFLPNTEWIIPVLVVTGSFSLYCGSSRAWRIVTRYFGALAVMSALIVWFVTYGVLPIHAFCWSGFLLVWFFSMRSRVSIFDRLPRLLLRTTLTAAVAIIIYDVWTGLIGHSLVTGTSIWISLLGQIPFTLRHLTSLFFVPPLVGLGRIMIRIPVPVRASASIFSHQKQKTGGD
ncbi:MAG: hypothetical protein QW567_01815 [Candidatus Hadarchaeales archaeon]